MDKDDSEPNRTHVRQDLNLHLEYPAVVGRLLNPRFPGRRRFEQGFDILCSIASILGDPEQVPGGVLEQRKRHHAGTTVRGRTTLPPCASTFARTASISSTPIYRTLSGGSSRMPPRSPPVTQTRSLKSGLRPPRIRSRRRIEGGLHPGPLSRSKRSGCPFRSYCLTYFVSPPPATGREFGPSAAYTLPSESTATPSPAAP